MENAEYTFVIGGDLYISTTMIFVIQAIRDAV